MTTTLTPTEAGTVMARDHWQCPFYPDCRTVMWSPSRHLLDVMGRAHIDVGHGGVSSPDAWAPKIVLATKDGVIHVATLSSRWHMTACGIRLDGLTHSTTMTQPETSRHWDEATGATFCTTCARHDDWHGFNPHVPDIDALTGTPSLLDLLGA